jgi:diguanylate cyclase (GGDEF)-like protein
VRRALIRRLDVLEVHVYLSLPETMTAVLQVIAEGEQVGHEDVVARAKLLYSDILSRQGRAAEAMEMQVRLHETAVARGWLHLVPRASMYLVSSADRLGRRVDTLKWIQRLLDDEPDEFLPRWHAEALMVMVMMSITRVGVDHGLLWHAVEHIRALGDPVLTSVTLANFGEVVSECDDLPAAIRLADQAEDELRRHPTAEAALTWESIARVRLVQGDLAGAEMALDRCLLLAKTLGLSDVNGDPALSMAELQLLKGQPAAALEALDHPVGHGSRRGSWVRARALQITAQALADLGRWQDAYLAMREYVEAFEQLRSVEAERAIAETTALQMAEEERRRAERYQELAYRDVLTGLHNRRFAQGHIDELRVLNPNNPAQLDAPDRVAVAIIDIDDFKRINDTLSHDTGDVVLSWIGEVLGSAIEPSGGDPGPGGDFVARLGGEEFLVVFYGVKPDEARERCEQLRQLISNTDFSSVAAALRVSVSIGLVCAGLPANGSDLIREADNRLYAAKRAGRDRVVSTAPGLVEPSS